MNKLKALAIFLIAAFLFQAGHWVGVRHAIMDSCIWTVERYDPDHPYMNARNDGADQTIYIDLDGNVYEHGMYQG